MPFIVEVSPPLPYAEGEAPPDQWGPVAGGPEPLETSTCATQQEADCLVAAAKLLWSFELLGAGGTATAREFRSRELP